MSGKAGSKPQGRTLWERMRGENKPVAEVPMEQRYENPCKLKVGGVLSINTIDTSHLIFIVQTVEQWKRVVNGNKRIITDYRVRAVSHDGGGPVELLVRVIPRENPDPHTKYTHHFVVLKKFFECGWNDENERKGILEAVSDPKGELVWQAGTPEEAKFSRVQSLHTYDCEVAVLKDENGDGQVEESEVGHHNFKLWDFHRETKDEAGQPMTEFLFVHQDVDSKDFEAWRGEEVDPSRIRA